MYDGQAVVRVIADATLLIVIAVILGLFLAVIVSWVRTLVRRAIGHDR